MSGGVRIEEWDGTQSDTCCGPSCKERPILHVELEAFGSEYAAEVDLCEKHVTELGEHARMFLITLGIIAPVTELDRKARAVTGEFIPPQGGTRRVCEECGVNEDWLMEDGSWICHHCGAVR